MRSQIHVQCVQAFVQKQQSHKLKEGRTRRRPVCHTPGPVYDSNPPGTAAQTVEGECMLPMPNPSERDSIRILAEKILEGNRTSGGRLLVSWTGWGRLYNIVEIILNKVKLYASCRRLHVIAALSAHKEKKETPVSINPKL